MEVFLPRVRTAALQWMMISKRLPLIRDVAVIIGKMLFWTVDENCWEWEEHGKVATETIMN